MLQQKMNKNNQTKKENGINGKMVQQKKWKRGLPNMNKQKERIQEKKNFF